MVYAVPPSAARERILDATSAAFYREGDPLGRRRPDRRRRRRREDDPLPAPGSRPLAHAARIPAVASLGAGALLLLVEGAIVSALMEGAPAPAARARAAAARLLELHTHKEDQ
jgi:hypothetical protein